VPNTEFVDHALDQRLLTIAAGDNVVRLLPPLIVSDDDLSEAVAKLDRTCQSFKARHA
jgi:acetylornithine/N-succinyldiaminopimelate aminotransferase